MPASRQLTRPGILQREEHIARIAGRHAEALLAHAAHVNGYRLGDERFDAFAVELRDAVAQVLQRVDARVLAAELPADDPSRLPAVAS